MCNLASYMFAEEILKCDAIHYVAVISDFFLVKQDNTRFHTVRFLEHMLEMELLQLIDGQHPDFQKSISE